MGVPDPGFSMAALSYFVYVVADSALNWDGKRFNHPKQTMGVIVSYSAGQELRKLGVTVEAALSTESNLLKLRSGRIAAYVMQNFPANALIRDPAIQGIVKLPALFSSKEYDVPFSRQFFSAPPDIAI